MDLLMEHWSFLMITVEVNGTIYDNIIEANFQESMVEFTNEASFTIALDGNETAPFVIDSECVIYMDETVVMTGFIYDVSLSYSSSSHVLTYVVRDKTSDFSDSDIDSMSDLSGSLSLTDIIRSVASDIGTDITVVNDFSGLENFDVANDDIKPDFGDGAFEYVEGLARKRQVLLSTNADGEIIIFRNSGELVQGTIQNRISNSLENNVISCEFSQKNSSTYNKYIVRSQLSSATNKQPIGSGPSNADITDQRGEFVNDSARAGRQRCITSEQSSTSEVNTERAKWQHDFSSVESKSYSVTVQGHSIDGQIFRSNKLIQVIDDFARIDDKMLIKSVSATFNDQSGSLTRLSLVDKDSFNVFSETQALEIKDEQEKSIFESLNEN